MNTELSPENRNYLVVDTTTDKFVLAAGNGVELFSTETLHGRKHSGRLIPSVDKMLRDISLDPESLDALGAGTGPGSLTGIRVGLSFALTMAQYLDIPVFGMSAMELWGRNHQHPVIKAFRDKYYYAEYAPDGVRRSDYMLISGSELPQNYSEVEISFLRMMKEVHNLYELGATGDWHQVKPVYVMNTVYKPRKNII